MPRPMTSVGHRWRLSAFVTGGVLIGRVFHTGAEPRSRPVNLTMPEHGMTCPREEDVAGPPPPAAHLGHTGTRTLAGGATDPILLKYKSFHLKRPHDFARYPVKATCRYNSAQARTVTPPPNYPPP